MDPTVRTIGKIAHQPARAIRYHQVIGDVACVKPSKYYGAETFIVINLQTAKQKHLATSGQQCHYATSREHYTSEPCFIRSKRLALCDLSFALLAVRFALCDERHALDDERH